MMHLLSHIKLELHTFHGHRETILRNFLANTVNLENLSCRKESVKTSGCEIRIFPLLASELSHELLIHNKR